MGGGKENKELFNGVESLFFRMQRVDDSDGYTRCAPLALLTCTLQMVKIISFNFHYFVQ